MKILNVPFSSGGSALLYNNIKFLKFPSSCFVAYFRSTPVSFQKWNNKWDRNSSSTDGAQKASKTYIKYKSRQRRADAKKALNDLLFRSGSSRFTLAGEFLKKQQPISWDEDSFDPRDNKKNRDPLKSAARRASKAQHKRSKKKSKKAYFSEDFDDYDPGMHFRATFGNHRYSWSFKSWEESFSQSRTSGFEGGEDSNTRNKWRTPSDDESDDDDEEESCVVGLHSDRLALGLPMNGPLKIDEVKNAFRLSALKWHPDKHQGPSQALAEEKFKVCVSAYKSLCNALSTV